MKYRIIKDEGSAWSYRVQRKILGIWFYYWMEDPNNYETSMVWRHRRFNTEQDARDWIEAKRKKRNPPKVVCEL